MNTQKSPNKSAGDFVKLPDSELKVMQAVWESHKSGGQTDAGSLIKTYPQTLGRLKLTTVLTLISRLCRKGFIKTEKSGRVNRCIPLIGEDDYKNCAAADFIENVYKKSPLNLISAMFDLGVISKNDIDELRAQIEEREGGNY